MQDYVVEIGLKHNEIPAVINVETGETRPLPRGRKQNTDSVKFKWNNSFNKNHDWYFKIV